MSRQIVLNQIGYVVKGEALLNLWGGGQGTIPMNPTFIEELTTENVLKAINDNGFGCESYAGAEVSISVVYDRGVTEPFTSVSFSQENLWGITNINVDFKKLADDYEKNHEPITDKELI
mgnify:CR=1 FL=1